jgi:AMME syndrome candidate gene 1 protein
MATTADCLFCFETLTSSLEKRSSLSRQQVQDLYFKYQAFLAGSSDEDLMEGVQPAKSKAIDDLSSPSSQSSTPISFSSKSSDTSTLAQTDTEAKPKSFFSLPGLKRQTNTQETQEEPKPLFVTWNTLASSGHKSLRGCIGTFEAQELGEGLKSYALTSAFDDVRFNPISKKELDTLECGYVSSKAATIV